MKARPSFIIKHPAQTSSNVGAVMDNKKVAATALSFEAAPAARLQCNLSWVSATHVFKVLPKAFRNPTLNKKRCPESGDASRVQRCTCGTALAAHLQTGRINLQTTSLRPDQHIIHIVRPQHLTHSDSHDHFVFLESLPSFSLPPFRCKNRS